MVKEVKESKPLTLAEVRSTLTKRGKKAELSYIQRVTLEHTIKFSPLNSRTARALVKKLMKGFELDEDLAIQLVNILPSTAPELAAFLARSPRTYTKEETKGILGIIKESQKKATMEKKTKKKG